MNKNPSQRSLDELSQQHNVDELVALVTDPVAKARLKAVLNVVHIEWARFNDIYLINRRRNFNTKTVQIVSAGLVPVVATLPQLHLAPQGANVLAAIFGAIAAACGIFDATWHAHDMVVRSLMTRDRLSLELLRFEGGTGSYGVGTDLQRVAAFTASIANILEREISDFSSSEQGKPPASAGNKQNGDGEDHSKKDGGPDAGREDPVAAGTAGSVEDSGKDATTSPVPPSVDTASPPATSEGAGS